MMATVDLGSSEVVTGLSTGVYLYQDAWIFEPESILWEGSMDGQSWFTMAEYGPSAVLKRDDRQMRLEIEGQFNEVPREARFIRMTASNAGACPDWHAAAGADSWLFLDEMVVRTVD